MGASSTGGQFLTKQEAKHDDSQRTGCLGAAWIVLHQAGQVALYSNWLALGLMN